MKVSIRSLENSDIEHIVDLILPIQQIEFGVSITLTDQLDLGDIEKYYTREGGNFWGFFIEGQLCGTIGLLLFSETQAAIRKMFVKKEFRGKELGIASLLLDELIRYSKNNGIKNLYLGTVNILGAAIRFYEKNGFEKIEKKELPLDFPLMQSDNIFCKLDLNNEYH